MSTPVLGFRRHSFLQPQSFTHRALASYPMIAWPVWYPIPHRSELFANPFYTAKIALEKKEHIPVSTCCVKWSSALNLLLVASV